MRKFIFLISIILSCVVCGQNPSITIEVSDTDVEVGQNVTISITSNTGGNIDFQFPKNFQKGYAQMEGISVINLSETKQDPQIPKTFNK